MKNYNPKLKIKFLSFVACLLLLPLQAWAAVLYLEPSLGQYRPSETFIQEIKIDTEGECINTIGVDLSFSRDTLEAVDFSLGDSILTLWIQSPSIHQKAGTISFAGGVPGGYCGEIPGAPSKSNLLGRLIFKVKEIAGLTLEEARFGQEQSWARINFLDTTQVLLNDGKGTLARLTKKGALFSISAKEIIEEPLEDLWQQELEKDNIPPERFPLEIGHDPAIYDGKYFLTFSTTDKQTGVDRYEVSEQKRIMLGFWGEAKQEIAGNIYFLKDQELRSKIVVKAVDKAENERVETIMPKIHWKDVLPWAMIVLVIGGVIWLAARKIRSTKSEAQNKF